jgi:hypothetical protein
MLRPRSLARGPHFLHLRFVPVPVFALTLLSSGCASAPPAPPPAKPASPPAPAAPALADGAPAAASTEEARVLATVDRFFEAIAAQDKAAFSALLMPEGVALSQIVRANGAELRTRSNREVLERFGQGPRIVERYWNPTVMVHGPIAVMWAPYVLWADGKENHRGLDVVQLMQVNGEWRVATVMWTSEPEAPESFRPRDASALRPAITP